MMKNFFLSAACLLGTLPAIAGHVVTVSVAPGDAYEGVFTQKIWLDQYTLPAITLTNPAYTQAGGALPKNALADDAVHFKAQLGMERKRPFLLVRVPVYHNGAGGLEQLTGFTLDVTEAPAAEKPHATAKVTAVNSVLASGTWYKIAVPDRGVYKIDFSFLTSLGISGSGLTSANIRLFGNGGTRLPESNAVATPDDLVENALQMVDGGDGTFGSGDYFLFYANGPTAWSKDSANQQFHHDKNLYTDSSYYFISVDNGPGLRIAAQGSAPTANTSITTYNYYDAHELDQYNPGKFGKSWVGDIMTGGNLTQTISFTPGTVTDSLKVQLRAVVRCFSTGSTLSIASGGLTLFNQGFGAVGSDEDEDNPVVPMAASYKLPATNSPAFNFTFTPAAIDGKAYVDYVELNTRAALQMSNGQLSFRDWRSVGQGNTAGYTLSNASGAMQVWDITNPLQPVQMSGTLSGGNYTFAQDAAALHEFEAFDGSTFKSATNAGKVTTQNLHGSDAADLVIVTSPLLLNNANQLADFHRQHDGIRVLVASVDQIYNEFSSGGKDIGAIRNFMRYLYNRAGSNTADIPQNLLLYGNASYDYKNNRVPNSDDAVPTFESAESVDIFSSYSSDDFFVLLDSAENFETTINALDMGVSRIPVETTAEADAMLAKVNNYTSAKAFGPWRLANTYIGDNEDDAGPHLLDAEIMCATVNGITDNYNDTKVYLDQLPFISTPGGDRCPQANKAISDQIYQGTFLVNFNGHGSVTSLCHERVLTADDYNLWKNLYQLPIMVTATCEFSRFDNPEYVSAGEALVLKSDGGAIAMLTTTQAVFASDNEVINQDYLRHQFARTANNTWLSFGEAYRESKNDVYNSAAGKVNTKRFTMLGDPALLPSLPRYGVQTDSIIDLSTNVAVDSFKALGGYSIHGHVKDDNGNVMSDFNGKVYVTVYDKPSVVTLVTKVTGATRVFNTQTNIIYKGIGTATNGTFAISFIAPKDIDISLGHGKISYYAENGLYDAAGTDTTITVGSFSDNPFTDVTPPVVKPFIGDSLFQDGGLTGTNTLLYVTIYDETGINVTGNGVGHDLVAILDDDQANPYVLNDYYQTAPNTYQYGIVQFPVTGLADGKHHFTIKAWDVNDNSGEGTVNFVVLNGQVVKIENLMNYPNPFKDVTHFVFQFNHPNEDMTAQITIYSTDGRLMRTIKQTFTTGDSSHSNEITWDGTDNNGARLPTGVYPYRMVVNTASGVQATAYQKLVLVR